MQSAAKLSDLQRHYVELFTPEFNTKQANAKPGDLRRAAENIRCQSGVRDSYLEGLTRFSRYSYMVDTVLAQHKLPADIRYLPFVESSYNPTAYSKAGAAGMWQIMPSTARTLGLELNATVDERLDPEAATHGAARYLVDARKSLTKLARALEPGIGDAEISPFVITSYNYGVNGMRRAMKKVSPDYLGVLQKYKSPAFQVAVKNFYASFLAARHVTLNSDEYFGIVTPSKKLQVVTVVLEVPTSVERIKTVFNITEENLRPINLGLTRFIWHGWRMIPAGYQLKLPLNASKYADNIAQLRSMEPETVAAGGKNYVVRRGDTACGIARALGVNCRELITANRLGRQAIIKIGQKLVIPKKLIVVNEPSKRGPDKPVVKQQSATPPLLTHKVRKGESACKIALRYGVSCRKLISANRLGRKAIIYSGQKLKIPGVAIHNQIADLDENNQYRVRKGDFACNIAHRFSVSCNALMSLNQLSKTAVIFPGQKLKIPGLEVPKTSKTAEQLANVAAVIAQDSSADDAADDADSSTDSQSSKINPQLNNLLDTLPELGVSVSNSAGVAVYRVWVEADETIGHYADWSGLGRTKKIRQLNKMTATAILPIGKLIELPFDNAQQIESFERHRIEYHQVLSEELKTHYQLVDIKKYQVVAGDSVWSLSNQFEFPLWLFYRINPALKISTLLQGQEVLLPVLSEI